MSQLSQFLLAIAIFPGTTRSEAGLKCQSLKH